MLTIPILERILPKIDTSGECWLWTGARDGRSGYGVIWDQRLHHNRHVTRPIYEIAHGVLLPDDVEVLHRCDNPPCVRPTHLFTGTQLDNMGDARRKGRVRFGSGIPWAKVTEKEVLEIRKRVAEGETQTALAKEYGLRQTSVSNIVTRKTWTHI